VPLSRATRFGRFVPMHLVRRADVAVKRTPNCTAAMPTPRAFLGLEEPLPEDEPTSDAPCRFPGTPASAPCTDRQLSLRASLARPLCGAILNFACAK